MLKTAKIRETPNSILWFSYLKTYLLNTFQVPLGSLRIRKYGIRIQRKLWWETVGVKIPKHLSSTSCNLSLEAKYNLNKHTEIYTGRETLCFSDLPCFGPNFHLKFLVQLLWIFCSKKHEVSEYMLYNNQSLVYGLLKWNYESLAESITIKIAQRFRTQLSLFGTCLVTYDLEEVASLISAWYWFRSWQEGILEHFVWFVGISILQADSQWATCAFSQIILQKSRDILL